MASVLVFSHTFRNKMTLLSPTCYDRQVWEQFPLDFVYYQDQNVFCVHSSQPSCEVLMIALKGPSHTLICVFMSPQNVHTDAGLFDVSCHEIWTDIFPYLSTLIQVCVRYLLIGYQCSCLVWHSVHHLSTELSICLIFVDLFTLEWISDCAYFKR